MCILAKIQDTFFHPQSQHFDCIHSYLCPKATTWCRVCEKTMPLCWCQMYSAFGLPLTFDTFAFVTKSQRRPEWCLVFFPALNTSRYYPRRMVAMSCASSFEKIGTALDLCMVPTPIILVPVYCGITLLDTGPNTESARLGILCPVGRPMGVLNL